MVDVYREDLDIANYRSQSERAKMDIGCFGKFTCNQQHLVQQETNNNNVDDLLFTPTAAELLAFTKKTNEDRKAKRRLQMFLATKGRPQHCVNTCYYQ